MGDLDAFEEVPSAFDLGHAKKQFPVWWSVVRRYTPAKTRRRIENLFEYDGETGELLPLWRLLLRKKYLVHRYAVLVYVAVFVVSSLLILSFDGSLAARPAPDDKPRPAAPTWGDSEKRLRRLLDAPARPYDQRRLRDTNRIGEWRPVEQRLRAWMDEHPTSACATCKHVGSPYACVAIRRLDDDDNGTSYVDVVWNFDVWEESQFVLVADTSDFYPGRTRSVRRPRHLRYSGDRVRGVGTDDEPRHVLHDRFSTQLVSQATCLANAQEVLRGRHLRVFPLESDAKA